jgi:hypothetical protein
MLFVQHEPGPVCSTAIDKPFTQNYDDCFRYFQKSYDYATAVGTTGSPPGEAKIYNVNTAATTSLVTGFPFSKPLAKDPTVIGYSQVSGTPNTCRLLGADYTISGITAGQKAVGNITCTTAVPANSAGYMHYTADTGW